MRGYRDLGRWLAGSLLDMAEEGGLKVHRTKLP